MGKRIPEDAFEQYYLLGPERSYRRLASSLAVSKQAIAKKAKRESWQGRVLERDRKMQAAVASKVEGTLEALNERHLRILRGIQARALEVLKKMPLNTGMEAVRALELSIKQERLILGEPSDRTAVSVEETVKREFENWMNDD